MITEDEIKTYRNSYDLETAELNNMNGLYMNMCRAVNRLLDEIEELKGFDSLPWDDEDEEYQETPISVLEIFELWREYEDDPVAFARAIEREHGVEEW
jgi:hypothetical protein